MFKVGLTGGIGSGKTLVTRIFEIFGIPVYCADQHAKSLMDNDLRIIKTLKKIFGNEIYEEGRVDRLKLAEIIFQDKSALATVNSLVYPIVWEDFKQWVKIQGDVPYVVEEAAILMESGTYKELDFTITVSAPEELRIQRVMDRDGVTREKVLNRIRNQWTDEERNKKADEIIVNDEKHLVIPQVIRIHEKVLSTKC